MSKSREENLTEWERQLESCKVTANAINGRKQVHYTFPDGREMVEEYDLSKDNLLVRKWKFSKALGKTDWEYELGQDYAVSKQAVSAMIAPSNTNPNCVSFETERAFCWRIRNIPYPLSTYRINIEDNQIVLRTTNKKYFKRLSIPTMDRLQIPLIDNALNYSHSGTTLLVEYEKPHTVLQMDARLRQRRRKIAVTKEGDVDCNVS